MRNPGLRGTTYLHKESFDFNKLNELKKEEGIADTYINETEGVLVVKYDKEKIDEDTIRGLMLKDSIR
jgi:hypothetical protein